MYRRRAGRWALQGQAFDQALQLGSDPPMLAAIRTRRTDEASPPVCPILRDPALGGPQWDLVFLRHVRERHPILQCGPQLLIAFERLRPIRFGHNSGRTTGTAHKPST
jgi:hypothetical protein